MSVETVTALIVAVLGSGGLAAVITAILSGRKYKSESNKVDQEASAIAVQNNLASVDYVNAKLREMSEQSNHDAELLRHRNDVLSKRIEELSLKLQEVMEWIIYDNQNYRLWLETELRKVKPEIVFPECPPPPKMFDDRDDVDTSPSGG